MTPESKDGRENYMPKHVTSELQLNHVMLSTEVSNTLIVFCSFPGWRKALRDNKSFKVSVEAAYLRNRICNAKREPWSITFTHFTLPQAALGGLSLQRSPAAPSTGQGQGQPPTATGKGSRALGAEMQSSHWRAASALRAPDQAAQRS